MEMLYFTVIAVGLYAIADAVLNYLERTRGARFEHRQIVFFVIILVLAVVTFQTMSLLMKPSA
ncbi:MAG: hypothetical protein IT531_03455 [Burkholderiales bacterium]|nr:hypothetical protein [Burkholderiales bacterium]